MTTLRKTRLLLLVLALAVLGAACGNDDKGGSSKTTDPNAPNQRVGDTAEQGRNLKLVAAGKLTVCTDMPYPPFEYEENGQPAGIDVDVMRAIGGRLGLQAEFRDTDFSGIFAALEAGQCDVVTSSVSITDERKKTMDFSDGYYDIVQSLLVRKADEAKYTDLGQLRGRTVAVQSSTTGADYAKEKASANGYRVKEFEGADEAVAALKAGQVDAVLQDYPVNAYQAKTAGNLVVVKQFDDQKEQYGIAMKKGRDDLKKAINDALARIRQDDTYNSILRRHLGTTS